MAKLTERAIIARWLSQDRRQGYELCADGTLHRRTRQEPFEIWGPPEAIGFMAVALDELQDLLAELTGSHPNTVSITASGWTKATSSPKEGRSDGPERDAA
jgi:hypothetical protein